MAETFDLTIGPITIVDSRVRVNPYSMKILQATEIPEASQFLKQVETDINQPAWLAHTGGRRFRYFLVADDLSLNASARLSPNGREALFHINLGCVMGISDLFYTLTCYQDFFGEDWHNGTGGPVVKLDYAAPTRYTDYSFLLPLSDLQRGQARYGRIPVETDRLQLAAVLKTAALAWVVAHEEAHYLHGHLHYLRDVQPRQNLAATQPYSEVAVSSRPNLPERMWKCMEFQADEQAAASVVEFWLSHASDVQVMPYRTLQNTAGMLRTLFVAIGSVMLLFERANRLNGTAGYYPSASVRLMNALLSASRICLSGESSWISVPSAATVNKALNAALADLDAVAGVLDITDFDGGFVDDWDLVGRRQIDERQFRTTTAREWRRLHFDETPEASAHWLDARCEAVPGMAAQLRASGGQRR